MRPPSPGVQPPITTSWVWTFFTLIQCEARTPGWYGQSSFFATTPSMPCCLVASSSALPSPRWYDGVRHAGPSSSSRSSRLRRSS